MMHHHDPYRPASTYDYETQPKPRPRETKTTKVRPKAARKTTQKKDTSGGS